MWTDQHYAPLCTARQTTVFAYANSLKLSLPSLPDEPRAQHPKNFEFPKRTFGGAKWFNN